MTPNTKIYLTTTVLLLAAIGAGSLITLKNRKSQTQNSGFGIISRQNQKNGLPVFSKDNVAQFDHPTLGFSFSYPKDMNIGDIPDKDSDSETILIQNPNSKAGIQIYITSYDENEPLTAEKIKTDLPEMAVSNPQEISVGTIKAISFESTDESANKTREVWFNFNNRLYQITTYAELTDFLKQILTTWKFNTP